MNKDKYQSFCFRTVCLLYRICNSFIATNGNLMVSAFFEELLHSMVVNPKQFLIRLLRLS